MFQDSFTKSTLEGNHIPSSTSVPLFQILPIITCSKSSYRWDSSYRIKPPDLHEFEIVEVTVAYCKGVDSLVCFESETVDVCSEVADHQRRSTVSE